MKIIFSKTLLFVALSAGVCFAQTFDLSKKKVLYVNGYSHLDTEWRWDYKTTINKYIWNTLEDNFRMIRTYPDYIINFTGANRYMMMKEYYPAQYDSVKMYVKQGRWYPAGSSMEENDVMSPSAESDIRQVLYGNEFFRKEFGLASSEFMLPDCFGFPASLPSVLAHCGIKGFSTQKLSWGSAVGIPFNVGKWVGPDGESVIAALNPGNYVSKITGDLGSDQKWIKRINDLGEKSGVFADYMYYGTGDRGGSPVEASVQWLEKSIADSSSIKIVSAKADQMFNDITPLEKEKLPSYKGELLLTQHSAGSITSAAYAKRWNRKNEILAFNAEASSVMGTFWGGIRYDKKKMNEAWRLLLGSQFHDILPGTITPKAFEYMWNDELLAANQFSNIFTNSAGSVISKMDTRAKGIPVVVFNPLPNEREDLVEANVTFMGKAPKAFRVYDKNGREVPSQVLNISDSRASVLFLAKTESMSYTAFDLRPSDSGCKINTGLKVRRSSLENSKYIVKLSTLGEVTSIYDKSAKKELLASAIKLAFRYEKPDNYPAWNMNWRDRQKPDDGYVEGPAKISVLENGPARVVLQVERESKGSKFTEQLRLSAGGAGQRVEFNTLIDWATQKHCLKATFPLTVSNPVAVYNGDVGVLERGNNDSVKYEVPSHRWFDLTDKSGSYGVSILEDCKNGSDKPTDNVLRLTLLYTPDIHNKYQDQAYQDFGKHEMLYAVYGHKGDWKEGNSSLEGARMSKPLIAFQSAAHNGSLGKSFSFLKINNPDIDVMALKRAETSDNIILRIVETKGNELKNVEVSFPSPIVSANEVDGQERAIKSALIKDGKLIFSESPYHLRTFSLRLKPPKGNYTSPESVPVDLPFNTDVVSFDKNKSNGSFDTDGRTYPAEMLPDTIISEDIKFVLGPKYDDASNAVYCDGQSVKLPEGKFNRVYFLAASVDSLAEGEFKIDGKPAVYKIDGWSGYFGQWDTRKWDKPDTAETNYNWDGFKFLGVKPGYARKANVAFFTTHRHLRNGKNDSYEYAYIYKYAIDIPEGAHEILLPNNKNIRIFAISAACNENDLTKPALDLFDSLDNRGDYLSFKSNNINK